MEGLLGGCGVEVGEVAAVDVGNDRYYLFYGRRSIAFLFRPCGAHAVHCRGGARRGEGGEGRAAGGRAAAGHPSPTPPRDPKGTDRKLEIKRGIRKAPAAVGRDPATCARRRSRRGRGDSLNFARVGLSITVCLQTPAPPATQRRRSSRRTRRCVTRSGRTARVRLQS